MNRYRGRGRAQKRPRLGYVAKPPPGGHGGRTRPGFRRTPAVSATNLAYARALPPSPPLRPSRSASGTLHPALSQLAWSHMTAVAIRPSGASLYASTAMTNALGRGRDIPLAPQRSILTSHSRRTPQTPVWRVAPPRFTRSRLWQRRRTWARRHQAMCWSGYPGFRSPHLGAGSPGTASCRSG